MASVAGQFAFDRVDHCCESTLTDLGIILINHAADGNSSTVTVSPKTVSDFTLLLSVSVIPDIGMAYLYLFLY